MQTFCLPVWQSELRCDLAWLGCWVCWSGSMGLLAGWEEGECR